MAPSHPRSDPGVRLRLQREIEAGRRASQALIQARGQEVGSIRPGGLRRQRRSAMARTSGRKRRELGERGAQPVRHLAEIALLQHIVDRPGGCRRDGGLGWVGRKNCAPRSSAMARVRPV
jgi:hypothetical protein